LQREDVAKLQYIFWDSPKSGKSAAKMQFIFSFFGNLGKYVAFSQHMLPVFHFSEKYTAFLHDNPYTTLLSTGLPCTFCRSVRLLTVYAQKPFMDQMDNAVHPSAKKRRQVATCRLLL
jgi:hypothetical protein